MVMEKQVGTVMEQKKVQSKRHQQEARIGLLFLAPWLIGFILLKALPILAGPCSFSELLRFFLDF